MFIALDNSPRDYAWGSRHGISDVLGRPASGGPEAEIWFGTHPVSPTRVQGVDGVATLAEYRATSGEPPLGFLVKVLAAQSPLSLQVHPSTEQAREGFDRENARGIALDSPLRNYRDSSAKPELIMAVGGPFDALSGFRDISETVATLTEAASRARGAGDQAGGAYIDAFARLVSDEGLSAALTATLHPTDDIVTAATSLVRVAEGLSGGNASFERDMDTVRRLSEAFGPVPGILTALLLHRVTLADGEALFLDAGNLHAYLSGVGIEVMASSDNVLRGGLTLKHVDVPEVLRVARTERIENPLFPARVVQPGLRVFQPPVSDFALVDVTPGDATNNEIAIDHWGGPGIAVCLAGDISVEGQTSRADLNRGSVRYITADEFPLTVEGSGRFVLAVPGKSF